MAENLIVPGRGAGRAPMLPAGVVMKKQTAFRAADRRLRDDAAKMVHSVDGSFVK